MVNRRERKAYEELIECKKIRGVGEKWALSKFDNSSYDGRRQGRQKLWKAKQTWEETGHQESNLRLHSNKECSCTSAPRRSPSDTFIRTNRGIYTILNCVALTSLRPNLRNLAVRIDLMHRPMRYLDLVV
jgi:hypothetical protein